MSTAARVTGKIRQTVQRGDLLYDEFRFQHPDSNVVSVIGIGRPEFDESGATVGYVGTLTDVTDLKRMSESLRQSEANFRALVEDSLTGVYVVQNQQYVYVNPRMEAIQGHSVEELLALPNVTVLAVEAEREAAADCLRRCEAGEAPVFHATFRCIKMDGSLAHVETPGARMDWNGKPAIIVTASTSLSANAPKPRSRNSRRACSSPSFQACRAVGLEPRHASGLLLAGVQAPARLHGRRDQERVRRMGPTHPSGRSRNDSGTFSRRDPQSHSALHRRTPHAAQGRFVSMGPRARSIPVR